MFVYIQYPFLVQATNLGSWMRVSNTIQSADYVTVHQKQLVKIQIPNFNIFSEFYAGNIEEPLPPSFLSALGDFVHNHVPAKVTSAGVAFVLLGGGMARGIANASTSISVTSRSARYYVAVTATVKSEASQEAIAAGRKWVSDVTAMFTPYMKRLERVCYENKYQELGTDVELLFKLRETKAKYDPANMFSQNFGNI